MPISRTVASMLAATALFGAGCGDDSSEPGGSAGDSSAASGQDVEVPGGGAAIVWGDGSYGVVLAHGAAYDAASWEEQAQEIAEAGNVVVAPEDTSPESIATAAAYLEDERGAEAVALIGGSAGADSILAGQADDPEFADQIITLSANSEVDGLGSQPKLFIASEDESVADVSTGLAESAPGADNESLILDGPAHAQAIFDGDGAEQAMDAILGRLEKIRLSRRPAWRH